MLDGCFLVARAQEINHRNLDGIYTDVLGGASQEIFWGNLVKKMAYGQKSIYHSKWQQIKSLTNYIRLYVLHLVRVECHLSSPVTSEKA